MQPIILILGPTAGGKTALSIALGQRLPGEVLSADSMQIYRGMDIGTAKPTPAERADIPHHLIDVIDPDQPYTVDDWRRDADAAVEAVRARNRFPILVGGTNLYVKVFLEGMFEGPPADPALRASLEARPLESLHLELADVDPTAAARIHPNDRKRLVRALEVWHATGIPISAHQQQWDEAGTGERFRPDTILIGLDWPSEAINRRINARVRLMVEQGLFEEVRALADAGRLGRQAREALGYRQVLDFLEGRVSREDAIERIKIETRRFARKQRTWLKRFRTHPRSLWINADERPTESIAEEAEAFIRAQVVLP